MIKTRRILLILIPVLLFGSWKMHEFYVSLTEIRYNPATECLEISMRIFPDDLDRALQEQSGIRTNLATEIEHPLADSLLEEYLLNSLTIRLDGQKAELSFLGKETEGNALWCYLESGTMPRPGTILVSMSLLTEIFPDQMNIVQLYLDKWNRSLLLNRENRQGSAKAGK